MFEALFPSLILLVPFAIAGFIVYDRLIRLEYGSYQLDWERDGRPGGIFWSPPGAVRQGAPFLLWMFKTPEWARDNQQARRLLRVLRLLVLIWNVGVVLLVFVPLIRSM